MNQVYLYQRDPWDMSEGVARLNPFMNQVYLYTALTCDKCLSSFLRLNPFMNQVYLYGDAGGYVL